MNFDILGISELKWIGMGEFNSSDHYIYVLWARIPQKKQGSPCNQQESEIQYLQYNNLRYADDTILMAENEEELKDLLITVEEE